MNQDARHKDLMIRSKLPLQGAIFCFGMGVLDGCFFHVLGVEMHINGVDWTAGVVLFFAISFGVLGWVIGHLWDQRKSIRAQNLIIAEQFDVLRHTQNELLESRTLATVGRLAGGVAHEVRNPLAIIRASASMVLDDLEQGSEAHQAASFIQDEVDRLSGFVGRLLDFTRPITVTREQVSAYEVLERVAMTCAPHATERRVDVHLEVDRDLMIEVDRELAHRLVLGLATNAVQFANSKVVLYAKKLDDTFVALDVADDGPGIPLEDHERVFETFYTTRVDGTGLGLAMAQKVAQAHDTTIELLPQRGVGPDAQGACLRVVFRLLGAS